MLDQQTTSQQTNPAKMNEAGEDDRDDGDGEQMILKE